MCLGSPLLGGHRRPRLRVCGGLGAELVGLLRRLDVGLVRAGLLHHLLQKLRVLQHRAGAQMVAVERLALVIGHKQRALQHLEDRVVPDVGIRVMNEHTGLRVAVGVDVEIVPPSGDAAADILAVVLEIHRVELDVAVVRTDLTDPVDHVPALLHRRHQIQHRVLSDRHVVEVEAEVRALVRQHPQEAVIGHRFDILARVADRGAEENAVLLQQIHRLHYLLVMAVSAARVVGLRRSLDGEHEDHIAQLLHLVAEGLIDQRRIGVGRELAVLMLLHQLQHILLADHRLAAGHHVEMHAQRLALGDDLVHLLIGEVALVSVGAGPAADAVHVAGLRRVKEDQPRDIAVVFLTVLADLLRPVEERLVPEVQKRHLRDMRIRLHQNPVNHFEPAVVRILDRRPDLVQLFLRGRPAELGSGEIHDLEIDGGPVIRIPDMPDQTFQ